MATAIVAGPENHSDWSWIKKAWHALQESGFSMSVQDVVLLPEDKCGKGIFDSFKFVFRFSENRDSFLT